MTDFITPSTQLKSRKSAEQRFRWYGRGAIFVSLAFLVVMVGSILYKGSGAFTTTDVAIVVDLGPDAVDPANPQDARFEKIVKDALKARFPEATKRADRRKLYGLVSNDAGFELERFVLANPDAIGTQARVWFRASDDFDILLKGTVDRDVDESERRLSDQEIGWIDRLVADGDVKRGFNWSFFTNGDSREPELAGILSALVGSALTLLVCFCFSFPVGILAAIYLEEFAPKNRFSDIIEVNINNLAAVPSIVFGLLGLSMLLNTFGMPRSSPLVGGLVLSLMTLPTIIIAARASLRAVPPSIREAALGMGASPVQATFHHVAPLALPGILTGTIVGMAQALGETAPLLMIGMVAFIVDVPQSILEPATALPVQIFLWADAPERAFLEKTSAAIIVLLLSLITMNLLAIVLRRRFEKRF
ncbi:phosphate ABC transporter permease PstA [Neptunicoccus sediminis]|uniref:phosphate ABC transporter permease PstA n=1 Tax=Neptunicoccus sediminis TaxID=1892596 RepID=UPI000AD44A2D|nr:phosphate ABC transporter permease PstA [Neptunicoccus sediminis]